MQSESAFSLRVAYLPVVRWTVLVHIPACERSYSNSKSPGRGREGAQPSWPRRGQYPRKIGAVNSPPTGAYTDETMLTDYVEDVHHRRIGITCGMCRPFRLAGGNALETDRREAGGGRGPHARVPAVQHGVGQEDGGLRAPCRGHGLRHEGKAMKNSMCAKDTQSKRYGACVAVSADIASYIISGCGVSLTQSTHRTAHDLYHLDHIDPTVYFAGVERCARAVSYRSHPEHPFFLQELCRRTDYHPANVYTIPVSYAKYPIMKS